MCMMMIMIIIKFCSIFAAGKRHRHTDHATFDVFDGI